jgi:hypothetical protein
MRIVFEEIQTAESMIQFTAIADFPTYSVLIPLLSLCLVSWLGLLVRVAYMSSEMSYSSRFPS